MGMEIRKLHHAVTLARFLNFTRAAHDLNITQSALSRSIQALEAECRLQIFDRNSGGVAVTQAGREFIRHAEALLRNEAALRNVVAQSAHGAGGHIALGVTPLVARTLLAPVLSTRVGQSNFHAEVVIASTKQLLPMIMQETIDLGVCTGELSLANANIPFNTVTLAQVSLAVIVRKDHPLSHLDEFRTEDMERYPMVRSPAYTFDDSLPVVVGLARSHPNPPAVTVEDYDVLTQIVTTSDAVWVTAPVAAKQGILKGELTHLPIPWLPDRKITLVAYSLKQRTLSPVARSIMEQFRTMGAELSLT
jgi:DNA-binding transcriptional LysR family regulator